jgi:hypothetical protein
VIAWTTSNSAGDRAGAALRGIGAEVLAYISPAHSKNTNFFGPVKVDIGAELAQLGPTCYGPLRVYDNLL